MLQRYVSRELTHFVGRSQPDDDARYRLLVKILKDGLLKHPSQQDSPHHVAGLGIRPDRPVSGNNRYEGTYVCFCDIPVEDLPLHMVKYSSFGLSFGKDWLVMHKARPVFYIPSACPADTVGPATLAGEFDVMANRHYEALHDSMCAGDPGRNLLHLFVESQIFSFLKFFDHILSEDDLNNFYMEREWRVLGKVQFTLGDVRRIILPEAYSRDLRRDVPEYYGQLTYAE